MTSTARSSYAKPFRRVGRYALFDEVGHGGTASVHMGRLMGPAGFSKTVAIKRMHENVGRDSEVAAMFLDEARLSGRIRHPNVVTTTDLLAIEDEIFLVMEYVHGQSLASLCEALRGRGERMQPAIAVHIVRDALEGLHAAHDALDESGRPLDLVHRDVSPQNVLVGMDGVARVVDFGVAKALGRLQDTHTGQVKGKIAYMAPEQLLGQAVDRRVDVFAAGVMLWEVLAGRRLFKAASPGETVQRVLRGEVPDLTSLVKEVPERLARAVERATAHDASRRFGTAREFAEELEGTVELVTPRTLGEWVRRVGGAELEMRTARLREIESTPLAASEAWNESSDVTDSGVREVHRDLAGGDATRSVTAPGALAADVATVTVAASPARTRALAASQVDAPEQQGAAFPTTPRALGTSGEESFDRAPKGPRLLVAAALVLVVGGLLAWHFAGSSEPAPVARTAEAVRLTPVVPVETAPQVIGSAQSAAPEIPVSEAPPALAASNAHTPTRAPSKAKSPPRASTTSSKPTKHAAPRAEDLFSRN